MNNKSPLERLRGWYRKPDDGWAFGVVAGLCEVMGWRLRVTRLVIILLAIFFGMFGVLAVGYFAAVLLLPTFDEADQSEGVSEKPRAQRRAASLHQAYDDIGERLDSIEAYLHSAEARLRRRFADLD